MASIAALLLALPVVTQAQFSFITNNGAIIITGYSGPGGTVVIPSATNGLPVTNIAASAFANNTTLTNITIPGSVTRIEDGAFDNCTQLKFVSLANGLVRIGSFAFSSCYSLTNITLPTTLTTIATYAFYYCSGLTNISIPPSVTSIGGRALYRCDSMKTINVDAANATYSSGDGVLYDKNKTTLLAFPSGKAGNYAISNSVTTIGDYAFADCYQLTGVTIPASVTAVGGFAFSTDYNLTNAPLPASVTSIGTYAFAQCFLLPDITIPASVTSIGNYAFYRCPVPINVAALNPAYTSENGILFNKNRTTLIQFPVYWQGSYTIPNTVTTLAISAFDTCNQLISIVVPASVTSLGNYCFANDNQLTALYFLGDAPIYGSGALDGASGTVYYLPGTLNWGPTYDTRPAVLWNTAIQTGAANFGVKTNAFGFSITGNTNLIVVVEASTNLTTGNWTRLQTNSLLNGPIYFSDPGWTNYPMRFYRMRAP